MQLSLLGALDEHKEVLADYQRVMCEHDAVLFFDYGKGGLAHLPRMIGLTHAAGKPVLVDAKGSKGMSLFDAQAVR